MNNLKKIGFFCFSFAALVSQAQTPETLLMRTIDGKSLTVPVVPEGSYIKVPAPAEEGYYGFSRSKPVYLAPGLTLEMKPTEEGYLFKGKGSKQNEMLEALNKLPQKFFTMEQGVLAGDWWKSEPAAFFAQIEKLRKAAADMIRKTGGTPYFIRTAEAESDNMVGNVVNTFGFTYGLDPVKMNQMNEMQRRHAPQDSIVAIFKAARVKELSVADKQIADSLSIGSIDLNNEEAFMASAGVRYSHDQIIMRKAWKVPGKKRGRDEMNAVKMQIVLAEVKAPFIREYYAYQYAMSILKQTEQENLLDSAYNLYMPVSGTPHLINAIKDVYSKRKKFVTGALSPEFNFPDTSGNKVSLQSLRGKYVYIDLWATWCGPCKAEIPYLQKLEAKYHDKNIAFVSISIDELKDKQKWIDFVGKNHLTGIQLMADKAWETEFVKDYTISGIPRFILISPEGKIVSSNAKRPSDPELEVQLKSLL